MARGLDLAHQPQHGIVVFGAGGGGVVAGVNARPQRRVGPVDGHIGGKVMRAAHNRLPPRRVGKRGRGIQRLQPVQVNYDALNFVGSQLMGAPDVRHQVNDRAVVAGGGVHFQNGVQQFPARPQVCGHRGEGNLLGAGEYIGQFAPVVAGKGVVETRRPFQGFLGAAHVLPGQ